MNRKKLVLGVDENTYTSLLFLRSQIEPPLSRQISFNKLIKYLSEFAIKEIEDEEFFDRFLTFLKQRMEEERNERNKSPTKRY